MNDEHAAALAHRDKWNAWQEAFWTTVEAALGSANSKGAYREYRDVWVMIDAVDIGIAHVGVCPTPTPGERYVSGYGVNAHWETDGGEDLGGWALKAITRVRDDRTFFFRPS
jgi:hypothetical protein